MRRTGTGWASQELSRSSLKCSKVSRRQMSRRIDRHSSSSCRLRCRWASTMVLCQGMRRFHRLTRMRLCTIQSLHTRWMSLRLSMWSAQRRTAAMVWVSGSGSSQATTNKARSSRSTLCAGTDSTTIRRLIAPGTHALTASAYSALLIGWLEQLGVWPQIVRNVSYYAPKTG